MRLTTLIVKQGFFEKTFSFSNKTNIIYSKKNGCGKTTLIRLLLYALGFNIPNTKNLKFDCLEINLILEHEVLGSIKLTRERRDQITLTKNSKITTFSLPGEDKNIHQILFNTSNTDIINNLLGTFYIDQEKGWTLLNRGTVIGSIHFNIEELIRGLGNKNNDKLLQKRDNINQEIKQYRQIIKISEYQKSIQDEANDNITDFDSALLNKLEMLKINFKEESFIRRKDKRNEFYISKIEDKIKLNKKIEIGMRLEEILDKNNKDEIKFPFKISEKSDIVEIQNGKIVTKSDRKTKLKNIFFNNSDSIINAPIVELFKNIEKNEFEISKEDLEIKFGIKDQKVTKVKDIIFGINQIIRRKIEEKFPEIEEIEDFIIYENGLKINLKYR